MEEEDFPKYTSGADFWFRGLHFYKGEIYCYNILIWDFINWDEPEYLEISEVVENLLQHYNIYHAVNIIADIIQNYSRENLLVENHIHIFKHHSEFLTPKKQYATTKHRGRELKYLNRRQNDIRGVWYPLLFQTATSPLYYNHFAEYREQRPESLYINWDAGADFSSVQDFGISP